MNDYTKEHECGDCKYFCRFFCFENREVQVLRLGKCKFQGFRTDDDNICKKFKLSDSAKRHIERLKNDSSSEE